MPSGDNSFEIHQDALILVKSDRWAQRSAYDFASFAAQHRQSLGPSVTEADWYWPVAHMAEAPTVRERRRMSDVVKNATFGVQLFDVRDSIVV